MTVLIIGPNYYNFPSAVSSAFSELGWKPVVKLFDNPIHPYNSYMKIVWKLSNKGKKENLLDKSRKRFGQYIVKEFDSIAPDLVFIMNGDILLPETLDYFRKNGAKVVLWVFDNLKKFPYSIRHIDHVDKMFCFDMEDVRYFKSIGKNAYFLPQACDTDIYHPVKDIVKDIDIVFVGNLYYSQKRKDTILSIIRSFPKLNIVVFGLYQPWYKNPIKWLIRPYKNIIKNRNLQPGEVNRLYNRARIVLNIHQEDQKDGANPRVFEICGSGAFQLCDSNPYLSNLFPIGTVDFYESVDDLIVKIKESLGKDNHFKAEESRRYVLLNHTYAQRMTQVLSTTFLK